MNEGPSAYNRCLPFLPQVNNMESIHFQVPGSIGAVTIPGDNGEGAAAWSRFTAMTYPKRNYPISSSKQQFVTHVPASIKLE